MLPRALVSWSTGKDSAWALHEARCAVEVVGLLTVVTPEGQVSMHGIRHSLLERQVEELGLPCIRVPLPWPCPNDLYEAEMRGRLLQARAQGVTHLVFGDIWLRDVRDYRERQLAALGMQGVFPLWQRDTAALARQMIAAGLEAVISCVDPRRLPPTLAGRRLDAALLAELPPEVDPCGERGEFHTFVTAGPMFRRPIPVRVGPTLHRDGFVWADLALAQDPPEPGGVDPAAGSRYI